MYTRAAHFFQLHPFSSSHIVMKSVATLQAFFSPIIRLVVPLLARVSFLDFFLILFGRITRIFFCCVATRLQILRECAASLLDDASENEYGK